jgi:hypothetical protein
MNRAVEGEGFFVRRSIPDHDSARSLFSFSLARRIEWGEFDGHKPLADRSANRSPPRMTRVGTG